MIYGQYGSGKTNVLFKLCFNKLKEQDSGNKIVLISANYCTLGQNNICEKFCEITKIPFVSKLQDSIEETKITKIVYDNNVIVNVLKGEFKI